jgi:hypothetical protein
MSRDVPTVDCDFWSSPHFSVFFFFHDYRSQSPNDTSCRGLVADALFFPRHLWAPTCNHKLQKRKATNKYRQQRILPKHALREALTFETIREERKRERFGARIKVATLSSRFHFSCVIHRTCGHACNA